MVQYANKIVSIHKEIIFIKIAKAAAHTTSFTIDPASTSNGRIPIWFVGKTRPNSISSGPKQVRKRRYVGSIVTRRYEAIPECDSTRCMFRLGVAPSHKLSPQRTISPPFRKD